MADDAAILDLDKGTELVCFAEAVGPPELLDVAQAVRRRIVVVGDPQVERELGEPLDRLDIRLGEGYECVTAPWARMSGNVEV